MYVHVFMYKKAVCVLGERENMRLLDLLHAEVHVSLLTLLFQVNYCMYFLFYFEMVIPPPPPFSCKITVCKRQMCRKFEHLFVFDLIESVHILFMLVFVSVLR